MNQINLFLHCLVLTCVIFPILCSLDFYINSTEAKKILGLAGDIYYVRDGKIQSNAVNFIMTVPPRVNCLKFVWYSKQVPSNDMSYLYTLQMKSDTPDLLLKPKVDIKEGGSVPNMKKEFCVNMTCRGTKQGTAHLLIQINITSPKFKFGQKTRVLNLRRIKTCRKGGVIATSKKPTLSRQIADSESSTSAPLMDKTTVFYIAVGVACSTILVIALAVAAIHVHSMPNPSKESGFVSFFLCLSKASLNSALRKEIFVTENLTVYIMRSHIDGVW